MEIQLSRNFAVSVCLNYLYFPIFPKSNSVRQIREIKSLIYCFAHSWTGYRKTLSNVKANTPNASSLSIRYLKSGSVNNLPSMNSIAQTYMLAKRESRNDTHFSAETKTWSDIYTGAFLSRSPHLSWRSRCRRRLWEEITKAPHNNAAPRWKNLLTKRPCCLLELTVHKRKGEKNYQTCLPLLISIC